MPEFANGDRSAFAIRPRDPDVADINGHAAGLGLSIFYAPSMRNGPELREDRGNAIISTEPLLDPIALELPLARQRRVTASKIWEDILDAVNSNPDIDLAYSTIRQYQTILPEPKNLSRPRPQEKVAPKLPAED